MNVPVWARRLQTVPAAVRRDSALPNLYDLIVFVALAPLASCWPRERQGYERRFQRLKLAPSHSIQPICRNTRFAPR